MSTNWPRYLAQYGATLINNGYRIIPITPGGKYPKGLDNWQQTIATPEVLNRWLANGRTNDGVGILTEWAPAVDIDVYDEKLSQDVGTWIDQNIGIGMLRIGQVPKRLLVFRALYPFPKTHSAKYWIKGQFHPGKFDKQGNPEKVLCRVEVLGAGEQFVAHAIHPDTQQPYQWIDGDLIGTPWQDLDPLTHEQAKLICAQFDAMAQVYVQAGLWEKVLDGNYHGASHALVPQGAGFDALDVKLPRDDVTVDQIRDMLWMPEILAKAEDREAWIRVGAALSHQFSGGEAGREIWQEWSETAYNYAGESDIDYRWGTFKHDKAYRALTIGLLFGWATEARETVAAFRLQGLESELAQVTDYERFATSPLFTQVRNFLRDNPKQEAHIAKLLKEKANAPRIDTLKKAIRPPKVAKVTPPMAGAMDFERDIETGRILTTQGNVNIAVRGGGYARFAWDEFLAQVVVSVAGSAWRPLTDNDFPRILVYLESLGFFGVSKEKIKDSVYLVAEENSVDSAIDWASGLRWDGTWRVATFFTTYMDMPDTAYHRAVALYTFSGMAARLLSPGCKIDMAPVLISKEGLRKSSLVEALAPTHISFGLLDLSVSEDNLSRMLRGKLILEWAELKGIKGKDEDSIKAFFTQKFQEWVPKYKEQQIRYLRRCFAIGTANGYDVLPAHGEARRWLPLAPTSAARVEAVVQDRDQLWAEAIHLYREYGVLWEEADKLSPDQRTRFREEDPLMQAAEKWLKSPDVYGTESTGKTKGDSPFKMVDLIEALFALGHRNVTAQKLGPPLRALGYDNVPAHNPESGRTERRWTKVGLDS